MRFNVLPLCLALALITLTLAACTRRGETPMASTLGEDDDTFCRANNVVVGSPEYVACRKDRDAQRSNAAAHADKKQRDLGEYMLNNPVRP
jgi:DICT domain-containing protein